MRYLLLLSIVVSFLTSCEKRDCECADDINVDWSDDELAEAIYIRASNAVLNIGLPFAMEIAHRDLINNPQDPKWELRSIKISYEGKVIENTTSTSQYIGSGRSIEIPHEVFDPYTDGLITGVVSFDMEIFFQEFNATAQVTGSFYYYDCEIFAKEGFGQEECRWPNQVIGAFQIPLPC